MKKNLLWTLLAALTFVGCSEDELVESGGNALNQNAVTFDTYVSGDAQSRATVVDNTTLKTEGFGVNAWYTEKNSFAAADISSYDKFMTNTKVTFSEEKGWTYSPLKYWPNNKDHMVSFFAYGPYSVNSMVNGTDINFTVAEDVKEQVDLIYHNQTTNKTIDIKKPAVGTKVEFKFDHALSRISFSVEAASDVVSVDPTNTSKLDANTVINVKKVVVMEAGDETTPADPAGPFYKSGTLSLIDGTWSDKSTDFQGFTFTGEHFYRTVKADDIAKDPVEEIDVVQLHKFNNKQDLLNDESYLMIIPNDEGEKTNFNLYIEYDVITETPEGKDVSKITNCITSDKPLKVEFKQGMAYNFNLVLGMTSVQFNVDEVTEWNNATDYEDEEWLPENMAKEIQGLGTEQNPYEIWTLDNLMEMRDNINGNDAREVPEGGRPWASAVYKQMDDVTVTSTSRANESWEPVSSFSGTYLGNGKKIIGLTINSEDTENSKSYAWIASNSGTIQDLTMQDVNITTATNASAIAGSNSGRITNCRVDGSLTGAYVGGLVYDNMGTISDCTNLATLSSSNELGGIACDNSSKDNARIINCQNYGNGTTSSSSVRNVNSQGGIVAKNYASIENCYNYGNIAGIRVGGIAGTISNSGAATACYNEGTITGIHNEWAYPGGIAGFTSSATIVACYNHGAVIAAEGVSLDYSAGGIAGYNNGTTTIKGCYHSNNDSYEKCGGLLGFKESSSTVVSEGNYYAGVDAAYGYNSSLNTDLATMVNNEDMTWATAATAMNNVLNVLYANGVNQQYNWKYVENTLTPPLTLKAGVADYVAPPMSGRGTAEDPYLIWTAEQLAEVAAKINGDDYNKTPDFGEVSWQNGNYKLMRSVDLSTVKNNPNVDESGSWIPIGERNINHPIAGSFDGGGNTVSGLYINNSTYETIGFIGCVRDDNVVIKDLHISGNIIVSEATTEDSKVGGVVAWIFGDNVQISGCSFTGTITSNAPDTGGIAGKVSPDSENAKTVITDCTNYGDIKGLQSIGGIVGNAYNYCTIIACRNLGNISTVDSPASQLYMGGIAGGSTIRNTNIIGCYNIGNVTFELEDNQYQLQSGGISSSSFNLNMSGCYNTGSVTCASSDVDNLSLAGIIAAFLESNSSMSQCYYTNEDISGANKNMEGESIADSDGVLTKVTDGNWNAPMTAMNNAIADAASTVTQAAGWSFYASNDPKEPLKLKYTAPTTGEGE